MLLGAAVVFLFSGLAINAVARAAGAVVYEVRRQFRDIPGIMEGTGRPEYGKVVDIVTKDSLRELITPGILAVLAPVAVGFGLGVEALAGFLAGAIGSGTLMAVFLANAGGAWDNAKKLVEDGHHGGKGSPAHEATIIGDTVGDPFKDTAGPAINPLIKVMNLVSLLIASAVVSMSIGEDQNDALRIVIALVALGDHRGGRRHLEAPGQRDDRRRPRRPPADHRLSTAPPVTAGQSPRGSARPCRFPDARPGGPDAAMTSLSQMSSGLAARLREALADRRLHLRRRRRGPGYDGPRRPVPQRDHARPAGHRRRQPARDAHPALAAPGAGRRRRVEAALPGLLDPLCTAGLLERSVGEVRARVDVRPYAADDLDLWVASDLTPGLDGRRAACRRRPRPRHLRGRHVAGPAHHPGTGGPSPRPRHRVRRPGPAPRCARGRRGRHRREPPRRSS